MPPEDAAAVVLPAADQPPGPAKDEPFAKRWAAVADTITDEEPAETPAEATPSKAAPKKDAKAPGDPKEAKRTQLKTLAEELGLNIDDSAVTVAERAEHRAAIRRQKSQLEADRATFLKEKGEFDANKGEKVARADTLFDAYERGDPEGFAKALGATDFNDFQKNFLKRLADPNYNELRRLQEKDAARDAEAKKQAEQQKTQAEQQRQNEMRVGYMKSLTETCQKSTNPLVAAFADEPLFLHTVYQIQKENWDPETESTVTVEQAIKKALKGSPRDLEGDLRDIYERAKKAFEPIGSTAPAAAQKTNGKKPAPKTAVVPVSSNGGGGLAKKPSEMSPQEWAKYRAQRMAEAED